MNFKKIFFLFCQFSLFCFNKPLFANNIHYKNDTNNNFYESTHFTKNSRMHSFQISPRLGLDSITDKHGGYFLSGGIELTWKPAVNNSNIKLLPELGIKYLGSINNISNKNIYKVRNTYLFIGLETPKNHKISTSLRFLTGHEVISFLNPDHNKIDQITVGGELMAGYQLSNGYELYGTVGITQHTQLMAINLAIII